MKPMSPFKIRRSRTRRAQAMLEMVFVLPILLTLAALVIQYTIYMNTAAAVTNLSREGARYAAANSGSTDDAIKDFVESACPDSLDYADIGDTNVTITPTVTSRSVAGTLITVTITYNMAKKRFLPASLFGFQIFSSNYVAQTTMMSEPR